MERSRGKLLDPAGMRARDPAQRGVVEQHGSLQVNDGVWEQIVYYLTAEEELPEKGDEVEIGLEVAEAVPAGSPFSVTVVSEAEDLLLKASVRDELGREVASELLENRGVGEYSIDVGGDLVGGVYEIVVDRGALRAAAVTPVRGQLLVVDEADLERDMPDD